MNLDRSFFAVFVDFGPKLGIASVELELGIERREIVRRVAGGEWGPRAVEKAIEFNPAEGWSRDITDDIRIEVERYRDERHLEAAE